LSQDTTPPSPRIAALQHEIVVEGSSAIERFWTEIGRVGAPLIEPLDHRRRLVTFVWRGADVRNVLLVSGLTGFDFGANLLTRLPGSDVWYRTIEAPSDVRTTYRLAPNDPLTLPAQVSDWEERTHGWLPDPLNPAVHHAVQYTDRGNDVPAPASVLELPDAAPQPWVAPRPNTPAGETELLSFRSATLGNERRVWLYTPAGYDPTAGPYPLLVLFDGFAYTHTIPTPTILDNLIAAGRIPPLVAVMPDSVSRAARDAELTCNPLFTDVLADELLPWAGAHRSITTDPSLTIVAGSSYGGLASAYAAMRRPEVFGAVLSQSGSYWWKPALDDEPEQLIREYEKAPRLPVRYYLDVGLLEDHSVRGGPSPVQSNRRMRDVLHSKGYDVHYAEYSGGHDTVCWQGTLADGLIALLGPGTRERL